MKVWFGAGFALGLLLLGNSVASYWRMSRIAVDVARRDLAAQAVAVEKIMQGVRPASRVETAELLEEIRASSKGRIAWIRIRNGGERQPGYETRMTRAGRVVVAVFPIRGPATQLAAYRSGEALRVVELAEYVRLLPLEWNLLINLIAALGLLGWLGITGLRWKRTASNPGLPDGFTACGALAANVIP
ncbi:MAG: hypothetical protein HYX27_27825 [Acidobacteria bacterium]|nr:hypothetical protein [Acidobacteriota bacterium]